MKLQDYREPLEIPGVFIVNPKVHKDDGGDFCEISRLHSDPHDGLLSAEIRNNNGCFDVFGTSRETQINYSVIHPGMIKAFHVHKIQSEVWFAPKKILVNLIDLRDVLEEPDDNVVVYRAVFAPKIRLVLENQLLTIPAGVAHGLANPYDSDRSLIYLVDRHFNKQDEFRLPWDVVSKSVWEIQKG